MSDTGHALLAALPGTQGQEGGGWGGWVGVGCGWVGVGCVHVVVCLSVCTLVHECVEMCGNVQPS